MIAFDLGTCLLLLDLLRRRGLEPAWAILYAWNPLVIKELAGSAHVDSAMIFFLVLAARELLLGRVRSAWIAYGAALLVKPTPILLLPLFLRRSPVRSGWILPAVGCVGFLPFWRSIPAYAESLSAFARDWAFNAGPWNLFLWLSQSLGAEGRAWADGLSLALTLCLIGVVVWTDDGSERAWYRGASWILGGYVLLSPTVMPWYLLWALPWVVLRPTWLWPGFTVLSLLSYAVYVDGQERWTVLAVEYGLLTVLCLCILLRPRPKAVTPQD